MEEFSYLRSQHIVLRIPAIEPSQRGNMPFLHLRGRVLPEHSDITIHDAENVFWKPDDPDEDPIGFRIEIKNSRIDAICHFDSYETADKSSLYRQAIELCRVYVDLIAFRKGLPLTVLLDYYVMPDRSLKPIDFEYAHLGELCTAFILEDVSFAAMRSIFLEDPALIPLMNDLVAAISHTHIGPINCGRVIDGLRKRIEEVFGCPEELSWQLLRELLNLEKPYLKYTTDLSKNPRHGNYTHIHFEEINEGLRRSWTVMNRYLEFKKRKDAPLPLDEFQLLIHAPVVVPKL
jgi:hypothetical protein